MRGGNHAFLLLHGLYGNPREMHYVGRKLNRAGYTVAFLAGLAALLVWYLSTRRSRTSFHVSRFTFRVSRFRFRRWLPRLFLLVASLAILGGVLYPPTNYDGLAYRTPRVLHWLAAGRWHWIHTEFNRLNTRAPGYEWICAPIIALSGTDRLLFLIESVSFCLLPGLVFSAFRRLGVRPRVAWHWMWLAPTGYCFLLQAGGIANDLAGAVFALAALDFALRAAVSKRAADVWLAMLAAALMTAGKATALPLCLAVAAAFWPALPVLRRRVAATIGVALIGVLASFLPSAVLNARHCGDWSGLKAEHNEFQQGKPLLRVANNSVLLLIQNFTPPLFPFAGAWNRAVQRVMPASWRTELERWFEPGGAHWEAAEMEIEEFASLGLGVSGMLLVSLVAGISYARRQAPRSTASGSKAQTALILGCSWIAFLALLSKSGIGDIGRISAPYYLVLAPTFLLGPCQSMVVRSKWWQRLAAVVLAMAGVLVVVSPSRPLWPAQWVLSRAGAKKHPILEHARLVYELHATRADALAPARELLPPGVPVVGLVSFDDPETSLWRPFGSRRVEHITPEDTVDRCHERGISYVLIHRTSFTQIFKEPLEGWINRMNAQVVGKVTLKLKGTLDADDWVLVKLPGEQHG